MASMAARPMSASIAGTMSGLVGVSAGLKLVHIAPMQRLLRILHTLHPGTLHRFIRTNGSAFDRKGDQCLCILHPSNVHSELKVTNVSSLLEQ
ncbi:hypothetical protein BX616_001853 [Lobosporangium transversale]|nr:hypothetical protein BX616_001853 [Lobosporangium transversale]